MRFFIFPVFALVFLLLFAGCVSESPGSFDSLGSSKEQTLDNLSSGSSLSDSSDFDSSPLVSGQEDNALQAEIYVSTDKSSYGSSENIMISVGVSSSSEIPEATVKVRGIYAGGMHRISSEESFSLVQGDNSFLFSEKTPYCTSGCGGVHAGQYSITAELEVNGKTIALSETQITLTQ